jgi:hypothetical protein
MSGHRCQTSSRGGPVDDGGAHRMGGWVRGATKGGQRQRLLTGEDGYEGMSTRTEDVAVGSSCNQVLEAKGDAAELLAGLGSDGRAQRWPVMASRGEGGGERSRGQVGCKEAK